MPNSEAEMYVEQLDRLRSRMLATLEGLDAAALDWKPLPADANSLAVLAVHTLGSERGWVHKAIGGRKIERDREAEFHARGVDFAALKQAYAEVARASAEILNGLSEAEMGALRDSPLGKRSARWCILHVIEHYSEHCGHMELTRQLWSQPHQTPV